MAIIYHIIDDREAVRKEEALQDTKSSWKKIRLSKGVGRGRCWVSYGNHMIADSVHHQKMYSLQKMVCFYVPTGPCYEFLKQES